MIYGFSIKSNSNPAPLFSIGTPHHGEAVAATRIFTAICSVIRS
jgi:hypothetical protein